MTVKTLIQSYQAGLFKRSNWLPNIISGIIVGVVALPLAMAFAIASGAKPEQGLYTAIVAGLLVSIFGGSRLQIAGPTGAFVIILSGITAQYGIEGLQIATLMAGCILFLMGLLRLGAVIKYIPYPVIIGFTAGIALVIWIGQWQYFFGLPAPTGHHFHEKCWQLLQALPNLNTTTTLIGLSSLAILLFVNRINALKKVPAPLVALFLATCAQSVFHFDGVATIGSAYGGIPVGLPVWHVPAINIDKLIELIGPAFAIAMLGAIESLLSAVIADGMAGTKHDSNQELMGQGLANIVAPLFGGFAATGAIARTATNIRQGGNSPLSGVIHSLTLLMIILFFAPLAVNIPLATLAAILFMVAWNMSEVKHALHLIHRAPRADIVILLTTFFLTVFVDLVVAVNVGVIIAMVHFLIKMSASIEVQTQNGDDVASALKKGNLTAIPDDILIYAIDGPVFFGAVKHFEQALASTHTDPKTLIIRLRWVPFIDFTGLQALDEAIIALQKRGVRVILCGAKPKITEKLNKAGVLHRLGEQNVFSQLHEALMTVS